MKNLLYLISILLLSSLLQGCQSNKSSGEVSKDSVSSDSIPTSVDTLRTLGDSIHADTAGRADSLINKDEKYTGDSTKKHEAPDHKTPDEAKLDSIKNAKKKKKKD
jgi:hypothetical protein